MTDSNDSSVTVAWGDKSLSMRGAVVVFVVCVVAVMGSNLYAGYRIEQGIAAHENNRARMEDRWVEQLRSVKVAQDRATCVSLFDFAERKYFRSPPEGVDPWQRLCPWIGR